MNNNIHNFLVQCNNNNNKTEQVLYIISLVGVFGEIIPQDQSFVLEWLTNNAAFTST